MGPARGYLGRPLCAAMLAIWSQTGAATALTVEEAARANVELAFDLCMAVEGGLDGWADSFRRAGFAERVERNGIDVTHWFTAPAETAEVELYYGNLPEHCWVTSSKLGVTAASAVLDAVLPRHRPGHRRSVSYGAPDPATGQPATCVRYDDPVNEIGQGYAVVADTVNYDCVESGRSAIIQTGGP